MTAAICWHKTPHGGNPRTRDPRRVTHYGCVSSTVFLGVVVRGATWAAIRQLTQPAARWWDGTRACLTKPQPVAPCGYTRDDGIRWRCGRLAHDGGDHLDPAYGEFR